MNLWPLSASGREVTLSSSKLSEEERMFKKVHSPVEMCEGNAFHWNYTLALPVGESIWNVQFDDWMFQMNDRVMLNKAVMSKFGIQLGEVALSFTKRST